MYLVTVYHNGNEVVSRPLTHGEAMALVNQFSLTGHKTECRLTCAVKVPRRKRNVQGKLFDK